MNKQDIKVIALLIVVAIASFYVGITTNIGITEAKANAITPLYTEYVQNISPIRDTIDRDYGLSWDTIDTDMFPYWQEADSAYGKDSRGTDGWINAAIAEDPNEYDYGMNIDSSGAFLYYNYNGRYVGHIDLHANPQLDSLMLVDNQ